MANDNNDIYSKIEEYALLNTQIRQQEISLRQQKIERTALSDILVEELNLANAPARTLKINGKIYTIVKHSIGQLNVTEIHIEQI